MRMKIQPVRSVRWQTLRLRGAGPGFPAVPGIRPAAVCACHRFRPAPTGLVEQIQERLDGIDWHREDNGSVLLGASLGGLLVHAYVHERE